MNGVTQMQELRCGNNFVSHNPAEIHFGLGDATGLEVVALWPRLQGASSLEAHGLRDGRPFSISLSLQ